MQNLILVMGLNAQSDTLEVTYLGGPTLPMVSSPNPANGINVSAGPSGQLSQVTALGATSGTFFYDDDTYVDWNAPATVNRDYLEAVIPYTVGRMNDNGTNYWYVEASNAAGTTRYPVSGSLFFTVTPSDETFKVNVEIIGLIGTNLVLQNNAGDDLLIHKNGHFSFDQPLANGAAYSVTVLSDPVSPSQVCNVTNGTGTISRADVNDITVACITPNCSALYDQLTFSIMTLNSFVLHEACAEIS